jgi:hypothetical protein
VEDFSGRASQLLGSRSSAQGMSRVRISTQLEEIGSPNHPPMKARDYFAKAQSDPAFRQEQLEMSRYMQQVTRWIGGFVLVAWIGFAFTLLITTKKWPDTLGFGIPLVTFGIIYALAHTRIAALEAMPAGAVDESDAPRAAGN